MYRTVLQLWDCFIKHFETINHLILNSLIRNDNSRSKSFQNFGLRHKVSNNVELVATNIFSMLTMFIISPNPPWSLKGGLYVCLLSFF